MSNNLNVLEEQLRELDRQIAEAKTEGKRGLLSTLKDQVEQYGITEDELLRAAGFREPAKVRRAAPAKYYDPSSGNSWSGRGPRPKWLQGKELDDYLIDRAPKPWWPGED
ncbi:MULTISPECIES: H-NS histone family protein [Burkholderia]|uniref:H-NS histone family protein n=1 Tax=Burkholderia TaxID=32008 RepID=UPI00050E8503|nr:MULTISPECIES: H-NS histone family protein [Burkholderia]AYQ90606.1 H-NS histone family protein [Burkholderia gladioli]KGE08592.1 histone [Burkholderia gladioli]KVM62929.1 histone [Burkholderia gladioli]MBU9198645.1 H-NS histone family protein [Burkholderia gladioli]NBI46289.1 H-NS histone family protein [Burkholderia sp. ISTR5]